MTHVVGFILECRNRDGSTWLDFIEGSKQPQSAGWVPVVLAYEMDALFERMATVMQHGGREWRARAVGCTLWGSGVTAAEAMQAALALLDGGETLW